MVPQIAEVLDGSVGADCAQNGEARGHGVGGGRDG